MVKYALYILPIGICFYSNGTYANVFDPLVVARGSDTHLQVSKKLNSINYIYRFKG